MAVQIQMRRGTASQWTSSNPTLAAGEWGLETDTDKFKIGDGTDAWNSITTYSSLGVGTAGGTMTGTLNFGTDGSGVDVNFYSGTAGDHMKWDASEEKLILEGTNNATVLDVTDGNVVIADGTLSVSGAITATGGVTGNVTGNASGTAATVTTAAQSAITSVGTLTGLTITGTDGQTALNVSDGNVVIADSLTAGTITSGTVTMGDDRIDGAMLKDYSEKGYNVGTSSGTREFSLTNGNTHWTTLTGSLTAGNVTFANPVASGNVSTLTIIVTQGGSGSYTIAWPSSVDWAGGTAPTLSTAVNAVDIFTFITKDGGTIWYGFVAGLDMK